MYYDSQSFIVSFTLLTLSYLLPFVVCFCIYVVKMFLLWPCTPHPQKVPASRVFLVFASHSELYLVTTMMVSLSDFCPPT
jgi:hypothetical protein